MNSITDLQLFKLYHNLKMSFRGSGGRGGGGRGFGGGRGGFGGRGGRGGGRGGYDQGPPERVVEIGKM